MRFIRAGSGADPSICKGQFSTDPAPDHVFLWRVGTEVVNVTSAVSTVQVHWTRWRTGIPAPERDETRTITLGRGDIHLLDYVENPDLASPCASLILRISADPILPQATQSVSVDVWTVDETNAGTGSVHQRVQGLSGDSLAYKFPPFDITSAGAAAVPGGSLKMDVAGTLQATLADDGFVDVVLTAVRRTASGNATIQGEGRVQFRTKVGETAAVLLPDPVGQLPLASGGPGSVDVGRAFAGHRLSLYVKVESVR